MSTKEDDNGNESKEPEFDEDKDQLEEKQEEETGELKEETTTNQVFWTCQSAIYSISKYSTLCRKPGCIHISRTT